jgi:hypothetical protein
MKKICMATIVVAIALVSGWNISQNKSEVIFSDTLNEVEALADETGSLHGRPLMQNTSTGAYKCANCTGSDCGAAC